MYHRGHTKQRITAIAVPAWFSSKGVGSPATTYVGPSTHRRPDFTVANAGPAPHLTQALESILWTLAETLVT